ncbi:hypothetical protein chiPu_0012259 [Chiloscyllium punctatum]|uniref:Uncharacterized protein n=1 Tax=Chiloscyllium punctatum TaxID=137246 RepID=A0A401STT6_CHIPU|nr:hypothetical protein [Chiloscyllium punctatum]
MLGRYLSLSPTKENAVFQLPLRICISTLFQLTLPRKFNIWLKNYFFKCPAGVQRTLPKRLLMLNQVHVSWLWLIPLLYNKTSQGLEQSCLEVYTIGQAFP